MKNFLIFSTLYLLFSAQVLAAPYTNKKDCRAAFKKSQTIVKDNKIGGKSAEGKAINAKRKEMKKACNKKKFEEADKLDKELREMAVSAVARRKACYARFNASKSLTKDNKLNGTDDGKAINAKRREMKKACNKKKFDEAEKLEKEYQDMTVAAVAKKKAADDAKKAKKAACLARFTASKKLVKDNKLNGTDDGKAINAKRREMKKACNKKKFDEAEKLEKEYQDMTVAAVAKKKAADDAKKAEIQAKKKSCLARFTASKNLVKNNKLNGTDDGKAINAKRKEMKKACNKKKFDEAEKLEKEYQNMTVAAVAKKKAADEAQKAEADAKKKAEEEAKARAEADAKKKAEEEAKARAEADAKKKAEEEAKARAEADAKKKAEEEAKARAEADAKKKAEEEAKARAEADAKKKAEEEAKARAAAIAAAAAAASAQTSASEPQAITITSRRECFGRMKQADKIISRSRLPRRKKQRLSIQSKRMIFYCFRKKYTRAAKLFNQIQAKIGQASSPQAVPPAPVAPSQPTAPQTSPSARPIIAPRIRSKRSCYRKASQAQRHIITTRTFSRREKRSLLNSARRMKRYCRRNRFGSARKLYVRIESFIQKHNNRLATQRPPQNQTEEVTTSQPVKADKPEMTVRSCRASARKMRRTLRRKRMRKRAKMRLYRLLNRMNSHCRRKQFKKAKAIQKRVRIRAR